MTWAWTTWLDEAWRAPMVPVWMTLIVAGAAVLVLLATLVRSEPSAGNGALAVIALLAIGVAALVTLRGAGDIQTTALKTASAPQPLALPALACLDELAGDTVQAACERVLFASPDHVAAAVSYVAGQLGQLAALDATSPEAKALRHAVQRDRYGLTAYLLTTRDGCTPSACAAFQFLTDTSRIIANMSARTYDGIVGRYMLAWSAPPTAESRAVAPLADLPPSVPTGRPTTIDYPTSDSIPPVSIMGGEPAPAGAPGPEARTPTPQPRPAAPAKRPSKSLPAGPVQLAPIAPGGDNR